jgi:hypothetical protein
MKVLLIPFINAAIWAFFAYLNERDRRAENSGDI